jgi:hypothetical protein
MSELSGEFPEQEQRAAVCNSQYEKKAEASAKLPATISFASEGRPEIAALMGEERGPRQFTMSPAYSGGELNINGFNHPVVVAIDGMSIPRKPIIRLNHDSGQRVGHTTDVQAKDGKLTVQGVISSTSESAKQVVADADNGFPWQASIGARPVRGQTQFVPGGKTFNANGRTFDGPKYHVKASVLSEVSFVDVGGDVEAEATIAATLGEDSTFGQWLEASGFEYSTLTDKQRNSLSGVFLNELQ